MTDKTEKASLVKKAGLAFIILFFYLVTSVPVGLFLYSLKSNLDIDIFSKTGFHGYLYCLKDQASKIGT